MDKKLFSIVALALLMGAGQAQAFSERFSWASAQTDVCAGCGRRTSTPPSGVPFEVFRIGSGGGDIVYHSKVPREVTAWPMGVTSNWFSEAVSPSGNVCVKICAGVVMPGASFDALNLSACTSTNSAAQGAQWENNVSFIFTTPLTPKDTTGAACATTACNGGDLFVSLQRIVGGGCSGASTDNVEFDTGELVYQ